MKIIKCVVEKIKEEIHDAESYIDLAMNWKEEHPEAADMFSNCQRKSWDTWKSSIRSLRS